MFKRTMYLVGGGGAGDDVGNAGERCCCIGEIQFERQHSGSADDVGDFNR